MIPGPKMDHLSVHVTLAVDLREFADWPPETTKAFMAGVAQVVNATKDLPSLPPARPR